MKSKILIAILIVIVVVGGVAGVKALQIKQLIKAGEAAVEPPVTISTTTVKQESWQETLTAIGSVTAVQGVTVSPEIAGLIREIAFESGAVVSKGDLLVKLDTSSEEAQLRAVEAQISLAEINLGREKALRAEKMNSQSDLDTIDATLKQYQANADTIRATIGKKTVRAPFSGRLGIRQVNLGQFLDVGKPVVTLQSLEPIRVDFSLPQAQLSRLTTGMKVLVATDAYPGQKFEGTLTAITPEIDTGTRSVSLQATFANTNQALRPGMFAKVEVLMPKEDTVMVIPQMAVMSAPYGDSVFIVEPSTNNPANLVARQQFIRSGHTRGDFQAVESGLKVGDRIASAGLFKLRNGVGVVENNEMVPKSESDPHPDER